MTELDQLHALLEQSDNIVFFGGAGVSTESGIPDFRSVDGLYHTHYRYPPETILSHRFFEAHPDEFYAFYRDKMLCLDAQPNSAHKALAVYPAAGLLQYYSGKHLVLINKSQTPADDNADLLLHESIGKALAPFCGE